MLTRRAARALVCILLSLGLVAPYPVFADDVQLVINNEHIDPKQLTTTELRAIFSMRKRNWQDNTAIRVFVLPDNHPLHKAFCKSVLKVYPYVLREQWDRIIFSGTGTPPTILENVEQLRRTVAATPGAIGYAYNPDHPSSRQTAQGKSEDTP